MIALIAISSPTNKLLKKPFHKVKTTNVKKTKPAACYTCCGQVKHKKSYKMPVTCKKVTTQNIRRLRKPKLQIIFKAAKYHSVIFFLTIINLKPKLKVIKVGCEA